MREKTPRSFLTAEWRWLAMLNYEVDPGVLRDLVPSETALDLWQGRALVSMVGFRFLKTRVLGLPIPFHRDFDEVNLRFYVVRETPEGVRRGVVFIKEIVPRAAIAWIARRAYDENYVALPMKHDIRFPAAEGVGHGSVLYEWRHEGRWNRLAATVDGEAALPAENSEESFITEHYWGYSAQKNSSTLEYRVEHPRWKVWQTTEATLDCDVGRLYGPAFTEFLRKAPSSAFVAEGSEIAVRRGARSSP